MNHSYYYCVFMTIPQYPQRTRQYLRQKLNSTFRLLFMFNPIKAGGLNLCIDWGASHAPPPRKKGLSEYVQGLNACL